MRFLTVFLLFSALSLSAETRLGKPLTQKQPMSIQQVLSQADRYTGKTVQVKGKVTEVCEMMGCWMEMVDPASGQHVRIKVNDGDIVFPKDAAGKMAIAEGKLAKITLSKEEAIAHAKEEAADRKQPFKPESVKGPVAFFQIEGTGAVLQD
jgi:hypothetical protein